MKLQHDITIALTKGRILKETLPLLAAVGIEPREDLDASRKLIVATTVPQISLVILRGSDVPTYVRHGAADVGIAGKDMLLESGGEGIYEPLDLGIARCRLMTAGPESASLNGRRPSSGESRHQIPQCRQGSLRPKGDACRPDQALRLYGAGAANGFGRRNR